MQSSVKPPLKLNTPLLPALVVLLIILQLVVPYQGWMILLVGLGGAWLIAYLWARILARGLRLAREMRFGWMQVGDRLEERFTLTNTGWVPALWVEMIDHSTLPDYRVSCATGVDSMGENRWLVRGVCTRRGAYTLGPTTLRSGDPFGVYTVTLDYPAATNMMVMPPIVPLPQIQIAPGGRVGEGSRRAHALERTVNAAGAREYHPGDSLSSVHWRISAHHDSLFVRLFDSTPTSDWWILLDLDRRVQAGEGQNSTTEHSVILAASLADRGLRSGRSVGLVAYGEGLTWLPPQGGETRRWEILRALTLASTGSRSLAELLAQVKPSLKQRSSIIVITPATQGDWIEGILPLVWRGAVPTVLLLDPVSFGGLATPLRTWLDGTLALLAEMEIARYLITRDLLDRPESRPSQEGHWDFRVSPRGRAVPIRKPRYMSWKVLA